MRMARDIIADHLSSVVPASRAAIRRAEVIIKALADAGYVIVRDRTDPEGGIPGRLSADPVMVIKD